MKDKLETHKSYMTTYRMYKDSEQELRFPLAVISPTRTEIEGKHGEVVRGYVACGVTDRSAKQGRTPLQEAFRHQKRPIAYFGKQARDHDDA